MPSVLRSPRGRDGASVPAEERGAGGPCPWHSSCSALSGARDIATAAHLAVYENPPDRSISEQGATRQRDVQPLDVSSGRSDRTFRHRPGTHR